MSGARFYIEYRAPVGNCALFKRFGRLGYTCNLEQAGTFTEWEAKSICDRDDKRRMVPCDKVDAARTVHVSVSALDRIVEAGW